MFSWDFPENRYIVPEVPDGRRRTRDDNTPAHLPAMNPGEALAGRRWKKGRVCVTLTLAAIC